MSARLAVTLMLAAAAPGAGATERDTLTIGIQAYPPSLNPLTGTTAVKNYVLGFALRPLTVYDKDWRPVCLLCTALPTLENGKAVLEDRADGKRGIAITFTLQPDATWGDGVPVTVRDVRFTWEVGRDPKAGALHAEGFRHITDITSVDDKTFTLHVDKVSFDYYMTALVVIPEHLERAAFADPAQYAARSRYVTEPGNPGLYFGPYRIAEVTPGSQIRLERNPTWWGKQAAFRRIIVRTIENSAALESSLLSGDIDYVDGDFGFQLDQAIAIEKRRDPRFVVLYQPSLIYRHIDLNLDNEILQDVRVRRALLMALDRDGLNRQLFAGKQPPADSFMSPLDTPYDPDSLKYVYDPAGAARLLDAAGWTGRRNGVRTNAAGRPLSLELNGVAGSRTKELVEQILQSDWRKLGIEVKIRNMALRVLIDNLIKRRFSGMGFSALGFTPEDVPRGILHSSQIPNEANNWAGFNFAGYRDPETDNLLDRLQAELDPGKRRPLWHALQKRYAENLPALPLYFEALPYVMPTWLGGVEPTGHDFSTSLWVENWTVTP